MNWGPFSPRAARQAATHRVTRGAPLRFDKPLWRLALGMMTMTTAIAIPGLTNAGALPDTTPPSIVAMVSPRPNANGWHRRSVRVSFVCSDLDSGIATCPERIVVATEGADQPISATATDLAGNNATATLLLSIDKTRPSIMATQTPSETVHGWTSGPFVVTFSATDALSGIDEETLTPPKAVPVQKAHRKQRGRVRDLAGNTARMRTAGTRIDQDNPLIAVTLSPPVGGGGFGNTPVTAHFTCSDATSGIDFCPADQVIDSEGAALSATGTVLDNAGNTATVTSASFGLDLTPPVLTVTSPLEDALVSASTVTIRGTLADALSGVASLTCDGEAVDLGSDGTFEHGPLDLLSGVNTFTLTGTDTAGNTTEQAVEVTQGCINLVQDPGFESGVSGFVAQDASSLVVRSDEDPLEGEHSLAISIDGYGNNLWWIRDFAGGLASRFEVSASLRSDVSSTSDLQFCAMVYYTGGATALSCSPVSGEAGDKGHVTASLNLNEAAPLQSIRIRLYQEGGDPVQFTMDSAAACLDVISDPTSDPEDPPPPPPPPPPPGPSAYPGYTYDLPTVRPYISLDDYAAADPASTPYLRLEAAADAAVAGHPPYAYSATHSVLMYRLSGQTGYIDDAIERVEQQVADAETAAASGGVPVIAGDSYLEVGWLIEELALTYDYGYARLTEAQRLRWQDYTEQALYNVWHPNLATWGGVPRPWSGWSIHDPGNNYHFSFLRATMLWALASQDVEWFDFLQQHKVGPLVDYYDQLPGGGSREGTGYGTAQKNLFDNYIHWKASTGEDLAGLTLHTRDTIDYWIHATVPTFDRFAPIGDQSRSSIPELFDYHENLVHAAVVLSDGTAAASRGKWWLDHNSVNGVAQVFNIAGDLLPYPDVATVPTDLVYHAEAVGHFFARSGWDPAASWLAFVAGPYDQSHAHQDQGSFTFFKEDWLAVTSNIWSHSGINQETDAHNVLRFVRNGSTIRQNPSEAVQSSMSYTHDAGVVAVTADLRNAYSHNAASILGWTRHLEFHDDVLRVQDSCTVAADVQAIFQIHVPVLPVVQPDGSIQAGGLHVVPMMPGTLSVVAMPGPEYSQGYRIELTAASGCAFDVELRAE